MEFTYLSSRSFPNYYLNTSSTYGIYLITYLDKLLVNILSFKSFIKMSVRTDDRLTSMGNPCVCM